MKAIDYIRKGWTKGLYACDKNFHECTPRSYSALRWCSSGAIQAAYTYSVAYREAVDKLRNVIGREDIAGWNDDPERTHEEVIAAFEKAGI